MMKWTKDKNRINEDIKCQIKSENFQLEKELVCGNLVDFRTGQFMTHISSCASVNLGAKDRAFTHTSEFIGSWQETIY